MYKTNFLTNNLLLPEPVAYYIYIVRGPFLNP